MKVLAFNGSNNKKGNTSILINKVFESLEKENIETEEIWLGSKEIKPCTGCMKCMGSMEAMCVIEDGVNEWIKDIEDADGFILGSPTQFGGPSGQMRNFIDRVGMVSFLGKLKHKAAVAVSPARRGGGVTTIKTMENLFDLTQCIVPKSSYWNFAIGDVLEDEEGMATMKNLGDNMAFLVKKLAD